MEILAHSHHLDVRGSSFSSVDGNQIINYNAPTTINIHCGSGCASHHIPHGNHPQLTMTSNLVTPIQRPVMIYRSADAIAAIHMAVGLINLISAKLTDCTDHSNSHGELLHQLETLKTILFLTERAIFAYDDRPLGQSLINAITPEAHGCCVSLSELLDTVNGTGIRLILTSISWLWHCIWRKRWQVLVSLQKKLQSRGNLLGMFLLALNSVVWIELGHELTTGHVPLKKFSKLLQAQLPSLRHIPLHVVIVVDHLGRLLPVPILFCSTWQGFHYIINGHSKGFPGGRFIEQGDYEVLRPQDSQIVSRSEFTDVVESGMLLEMTIVKRQSRVFQDYKNTCFRCGYDNSDVTAINDWINCRNCAGQFKVAIVDRSAEETDTDVAVEADGNISEEGRTEHGEEVDKERNDGDHDRDIIPPAFNYQPTGNNPRQNADNGTLQSPDDDEIKLFRRILVICPPIELFLRPQDPSQPSIQGALVTNSFPPFTPMDARAATRNLIIFEMVETEQKYVQDLEVMQKYSDALSQRNTISKDKIHDLFPKLNELLNFQHKFLNRLQCTTKVPWNDQRWGLHFTENEGGFAVYEPYCANYANASELMLAVKQSLIAYNDIVDAKSRLPGLLLKPISRIRKYPLLLESLINASSPTEYPYYDELRAGYAAITRTIAKIDEAMRLAENQRTAKSLESRIIDWKGHHPSNFGNLLLGDVFTVTRAMKADRECHVFLFEKIILCCREVLQVPPIDGKVGKTNLLLKTQPLSPAGGHGETKSKKTPLLLKGRIFLCNVTQVIPSPGGRLTSSSTQSQFTLSVWWVGDDGLDFLTLRCHSEEQMRQWGDQINKLIKKAAIRQKPLGSRHVQSMPPKCDVISSSESPRAHTEDANGTVMAEWRALSTMVSL